MEQTLTITREPLKTARLVRKADLMIVLKGVVSNEAIQNHLSIETDQQVHAFILEGVGAVQRWSDMIGTEDAINSFGILYFSQDTSKAEQDVEWCKPLVQPSRTSSTTSSTSSIPIKKTTVRKNLVSSTKNGRSAMQKTAAVEKETDTKSRIATVVPKKIVKATTTTTNTTTNTTSRTATTKPPTNKLPVTKTKISNIRKPEATQGTKNASTKKIPVSKGGVTKSTPPISVITGRTRKTSRVDKKDLNTTTTEKKKLVNSKKQPVGTEKPRVKEIKTKPSEVVEEITPPPAVQEKEEEEKEMSKEEEEIIPPQEGEKKKEEEEVKVSLPTHEEEVVPEEEVVAEKEEQDQEDSLLKVDEGVVLDDHQPVIKKPDERIIEHSISHISSGSSATTDEHDAEVAATMKYVSRKASGTPSYFQRLSPQNRPETPEVDQLRQRFETIIQTPTSEVKTPSKISPEFVARIKEMKPKGPAGARVKSMVELFMDENLNKWEF